MASVDTISKDVDDGPTKPGRAVIGTNPDHWLYSSSPPTFDLTRPPPPEYAIPSPKDSVSLSTTTKPVVIDPSKSALVIIDMQNFFLSTYLGRPADGAGNKAAQRLLNTAIPAARKAGIRTIWLNWGLTDEEIEHMPPSTRRAFGFEATLEREGKKKPMPAIDAHGVNRKCFKSLPSIQEEHSAAKHVSRHKDSVNLRN